MRHHLNTEDSNATSVKTSSTIISPLVSNAVTSSLPEPTGSSFLMPRDIYPFMEAGPGEDERKSRENSYNAVRDITTILSVVI